MAVDRNSRDRARVAVVTGGSRGIGRAVAERLVSDGLNVVVVYVSNKSEAEAAVAVVEKQGAAAIAVPADVADEHAVGELFDEAHRTFGGVDVVVNAAGVMSLAPLVDFDLSVLDRMHRTNIRGTFVINQQAARRVREGGPSSISPRR
jgi:3-oxoacyl-[acyl-carrier protein] reductase